MLKGSPVSPFMRRRTLIGALGAGLVAGPVFLTSAARAENLEVFVNSDGVAINGYDPVAYFTAGEPVAGIEEHSAMWKRARWYFSSAENRALFVADPEKYAPQYGGYCAFAVSQGYIAPTVPEAWTIENDKLYLNFSLGVRERWRRDMANLIARGDANWPGVLE